MDEIRRRDISLFVRELLSGPRIVLLLLGLLMTWGFSNPWSPFKLWQVIFGWGLFAAVFAWTAWKSSIPKRFKAQRFALLWSACEDRHKRFRTALVQVSRRGIADLQELPKTIDGVYNEIYRALRRSDLVATEVSASEGWLVAQPRFGHIVSPDRQAQELYRIADKNIAEYRQHYVGVMAGVERTEAQAAVFTTTLDTLRMKMLSYRLVGKETETPTQDFLVALTEARMQLEAIDKALDELELTPFPKTISVMPPDPQNMAWTPDIEPPPMPETVEVDQ